MRYASICGYILASNDVQRALDAIGEHGGIDAALEAERGDEDVVVALAILYGATGLSAPTWAAKVLRDATADDVDGNPDGNPTQGTEP